MLRTAALYGAIVAVFALLAWLAIGFNMLLIGGGLDGESARWR